MLEGILYKIWRDEKDIRKTSWGYFCFVHVFVKHNRSKYNQSLLHLQFTYFTILVYKPWVFETCNKTAQICFLIKYIWTLTFSNSNFVSYCCLNQASHLLPIYLYSIQHDVIKFVSDLRQVSGFLQVVRFPPPIKLTATI